MKNNLKIFLNVIFYIISIGIYVWGMLGDFFEIPTIYNPILTQIIGLVLLIFFFARNNFQLRKSIKEYQDQAPEINVKSINLRALPFSYYYEESNPSREYAAGTASPINLIYNKVYRDSRGSTDFLGSKTEIFLFTFIEFVNTRLGKGLTKTAKNATAQMDFFNEKLQQIHQNIKGKWADSNEPTFHLSNPIPISEYLEMDIPGNLSRELCSVGKIYEDTDCYIFNLDSYLQQKLKREKALIGKGVHYLRIYLKGSNFDDLYFWFKLINPGINSTTELSQIINKSEIKKIESMTAEAK